jgi:hypothetical protein
MLHSRSSKYFYGIGHRVPSINQITCINSGKDSKWGRGTCFWAVSRRFEFTIWSLYECKTIYTIGTCPLVNLTSFKVSFHVRQKSKIQFNFNFSFIFWLKPSANTRQSLKTSLSKVHVL